MASRVIRATRGSFFCGQLVSVGAVYDRPFFLESTERAVIDRPYNRPILA